jgi:hypothetical protein
MEQNVKALVVLFASGVSDGKGPKKERTFSGKIHRHKGLGGGSMMYFRIVQKADSAVLFLPNYLSSRIYI